MLKADVEEYQLYISRVRPIYHQIFNLAHAITGNADQAEYCLQYAMLDGWAAGENSASRHGFRESLRSAGIRQALKIALLEQKAEFDWDGALPGEGASDAIDKLIAQENTDMRRILALKYGCGLSPRRIAKITGGDPTRIKTQLRRFEARARRRLSGTDRRRAEARVQQAVRALMALPSPQAPEMGGVFRTFQADAASMTRPSRLPARILSWSLGVVLAIVCALAFWFAAVLIQPPVLETPAEPAPIEEINE